MRKITELLQEIPLDELTGDDVMRADKDTENKTITMEEKESSRPRAKRTGTAAAAVAACAVVAIGGTMLFANNRQSFDPPASQVSTDAEDSIQTEELYERNLALAKLAYETCDCDFELASPYKTVFSERVGRINSGFEGLDIRVISVTSCYPFVDIEVAVETLDGSDLPPAPASNAVEFTCDAGLGNFSAGGMDHYGNAATGTIRTSLIRNGLDDNAQVNINISQVKFGDTVYNGNFGAAVDIGKINYMDKTVGGSEERSLGHGTWEGNINGENTAVEYELKKVQYCNVGVAVTLDMEQNYDDTELYELFNNFAGQLAYYDPEGLEQYAADVGIDPDMDPYFVKVWRYGVPRPLLFSDMEVERNSDGTITLYYKKTYHPFSSEDIHGIQAGSIVMDLLPVANLKTEG